MDAHHVKPGTVVRRYGFFYHPGFLLLDDRMGCLELSAGAPGVIHTSGITDMSLIENKWEEELRNVAAHIYGMAIFSGGKWFMLQR